MRKIVWEYGSIERNLDEMRELGRQSWEENVITKNFDVTAEYDLYDDFFYACEQNGILGVMIGRDPETQELVGMYVAILTPWLFCRNIMMSSEVVWYIRRDYATKSNFLDFLRAVETANAEWGADFVGITLQDKGNVDRVRESMRRQEYVLTNLFLLKKVGG